MDKRTYPRTQEIRAAIHWVLRSLAWGPVHVEGLERRARARGLHRGAYKLACRLTALGFDGDDGGGWMMINYDPYPLEGPWPGVISLPSFECAPRVPRRGG